METVHILVDFSHIWECVKNIIGLKVFEQKGVRFNCRRLHDGILKHNGQERRMGDQSALFRSQPPVSGRSYLRDEDAMVLRELGYKERLFPLRTKRVECYRCGNRWPHHSEKTVDAAIISTMYRIALAVFGGTSTGRIALVSGDGDFAEAITTIQEILGVQVEVWAFRGYTSHAYLERRVIAGTLDDLGLIS